MRLLAIDDGLWQGNANLADVAFLVGLILFAVAAVAAVAPGFAAALGRLGGLLVPLGLAFVAFGWLVL